MILRVLIADEAEVEIDDEFLSTFFFVTTASSILDVVSASTFALRFLLLGDGDESRPPALLNHLRLRDDVADVKLT